MTWTSSTHGLPGVFVSFEGGEGVGKTTQIRFMESVLKKAGLDVVRLREPGGTSVGESLRSIVLDAKNDRLDDRAELYIYEAARAQIVAEVIRPALERGAVVLCDRFVDSTVAYQGYGRGLDPACSMQTSSPVRASCPTSRCCSRSIPPPRAFAAPRAVWAPTVWSWRAPSSTSA